MLLASARAVAPRLVLGRIEHRPVSGAGSSGSDGGLLEIVAVLASLFWVKMRITIARARRRKKEPVAGLLAARVSSRLLPPLFKASFGRHDDAASIAAI